MFAGFLFYHYLLPGQSNNQKAKIIHSSTIFFFILSLVVYQVILQLIPVSGVQILGYAANIPVAEVVTLTNTKRSENGLSELRINPQLAAAADAKGKDMLDKNYWAHVSPDGTQPWKFFLDSGYRYRFAGENLARDFSNSQSAVEAWMASPSHRENLLSDKYNETGIAVVEGDLDGVETTIIVQLFGTQYNDEPKIAVANASTTEAIVPQATPIPTITIEPTLAPTLTPTQSPATPLGTTQQGFTTQQVLISPFSTTRGVSLFTIFMLFSVLVVDGLITHKRKVSRIGGRTFAHLAFLGMIFAIAVIARAGSIL